jgi:GT2 family glycosyltransferase
MDISIIIVNYKSQKKALSCVESVKASDMAGLSYEIIIIDNASGDEGAETIREKFSDVILIKSGKNLGMGGGNNLGIKKAKGDYILILNPDIFVNHGAIKKLYDYIKEDKSIGLLAPKLLNPDGSLQYSCFRDFNFFTPVLRRTFLGKIFTDSVDKFLMKDFDHNEIKKVDWVMGSCFVIKKELMDELGGFDERFFMYFEDTDLCRRLRQAGYKIIYYSETAATHDHARASADNPWYFFMFNKMSRAHIASWIKYFYKWSKLKL